MGRPASADPPAKERRKGRPTHLEERPRPVGLDLAAASTAGCHRPFILKSQPSTARERPEPEYHDLVAYDRLGTAVAEYTRKGALVLVEGRLHSQSWKAQDGSPHRRVVVIAGAVQVLSRAPQQQ